MENPTYYILEDGSVAHPNDVAPDAKGVMRSGSIAVARRPDGNLSTRMMDEKALEEKKLKDTHKANKQLKVAEVGKSDSPEPDPDPSKFTQERRTADSHKANEDLNVAEAGAGVEPTRRGRPPKSEAKDEGTSGGYKTRESKAK